jgi:hypothetical protein
MPGLAEVGSEWTRVRCYRKDALLVPSSGFLVDARQSGQNAILSRFVGPWYGRAAIGFLPSVTRHASCLALRPWLHGRDHVRDQLNSLTHDVRKKGASRRPSLSSGRMPVIRPEPGNLHLGRSISASATLLALTAFDSA